jgi:DNA-binding NtrC family response regulator
MKSDARDAGDASSGEHRGRFLGKSEATERVRGLIRRAAAVDSTVLITGESGVGKELVARQIHALSDRSEGPFVPLNCAAIPDSLIETELFGHEAGAYTDARQAQRGAFELSHQGTLFLDEVGDLSMTAQPKLLRALETGEIQRVGSEKPRQVELRVVAATNQDLKTMCREKRFRADLYFRLRVLNIRVPPLRERLEDVPILAEYFARDVAEKSGRPFDGIDDGAMALLQGYHWPGNVRELRAVVEQALALSTGRRLVISSFEIDPISMSGFGATSMFEGDLRTARARFETLYVKRLLERHGGNVQKAARDAGLAVGGFYKLLRRLGLRPGPDSS